VSETEDSASGAPAHGRPTGITRRRVVTTVAAVGALGAAAVTGVVHIVRFVNPRARHRIREAFVTFVERVPTEGTLDVTLPDGRRVQVKRVGEEFVGFSNICPHLGCRVNWERGSDTETDSKKKGGYFRCPCHEGLFDGQGDAFAGPPADAEQVLERVPMSVRGNALYVEYMEELS
jgi:Rieske Fe-S protein